MRENIECLFFSPVALKQIVVRFLICILLASDRVYAADSREFDEMVHVPGGSFLMGSDSGLGDERPQHSLSLAAFSIDRTPVTNTQFARFMSVLGIQAPNGQPWYDVDDGDARIRRRDGKWEVDQGFENHPVAEVSWYGAVAYCAWLTKRLPTEAEWEKAARGTDGRKYPWGNEAPDRSRAHFAAGWNDTRSVGSFPNGASPYGVLDMAGNGWEWVSSLYLPYPYNPRDGREDMNRSDVRGTRGGGHDSSAEELTTTQRGRSVSRNPRSGHHNIGFRCAR
jgi:formylglycine-generating enzyme required for sulfatase activity